MDTTHDFDVIIVGSGMMGAAVARCLRDQRADIRIGMIAGGPAMGPRAGQHLHDVADPEVWDRYNKKVSSGVQAFYTGVTPNGGTGSTLEAIEPGMNHLTSLGENAAELPGASVAWNAGGMGIHWTAATPFPWGSEVSDEFAGDNWEADLKRAAELLRVNLEPFPLTSAGEAVARAMGSRYDAVSAVGRGIQNMPMAVNDDGAGLNERTSPSVIFPPIGTPDLDAAFTLVSDSIVTSVVHEDGRASGVVSRGIYTGADTELRAAHVIVCADAIRTPQLLFASGIRPEALGRYLNEHVFLTGQVTADPELLDIDVAELATPTEREWVSDCLWLPHSDEPQPYQVHIMTKVAVDEQQSPIDYIVGIEYYVPTEIQRENRLEFSDDEVDAVGMPRITVRFTYTDDDLASLDRARADQAAAARLIGPFDPATQSAALTAGSSLHFTGTVRMGATDDGTSVCDRDGRVWGFDNLFVAGNGVIPTALVCNSTLTGMTTAVRAANAVLATFA
jgi:pyranose oxidase